MVDFINKIISVILVFYLCIIGPLTLSYQSDAATDKRLLLNELSNFCDKIADKKSISQDDLNEFYIAVNSYGMTIDAEVKIYRAVPELENAHFILTYNLADEKEQVTKRLRTEKGFVLNDIITGDIVQVTIFEIVPSPARRMLYNAIGFGGEEYKQTLAVYVGK